MHRRAQECQKCHAVIEVHQHTEAAANDALCDAFEHHMRQCDHGPNAWIWWMDFNHTPCKEQSDA